MTYADGMQKYLEVARSLSNKELFEETFDKAGGDEYGGSFTAEGLSEFLSYKEVLEDRLALWMKE